MIAGPSEVLVVADAHRQRRLDRRRPARPGRARRRRPVDPDHRRRRPSPTRSRRPVEGQLDDPAARGDRRRARGATTAPSSWSPRSTRPCRWSTPSRPSIWRSRRRRRRPRRPHPPCRRDLPRRAHAGGDRRLCRRLQPRAADGALGALLVRPRRARLHEAHLDPQMRTGAAAPRSAPAAIALGRSRGAAGACPLGGDTAEPAMTEAPNHAPKRPRSRLVKVTLDEEALGRPGAGRRARAGGGDLRPARGQRVRARRPRRRTLCAAI